MWYFRKLGECAKNFFDPEFGLDPASEQAARLRALQVFGLGSLTPYMMVTNFLCGAIAYLALKNVVDPFTIGIWYAGLALLSGMGLASFFKNRNAPKRRHVSKRAISKAALWSGCLASFWAALAAFFYPQVPVEKHSILIAIISGMMGGGVISLYVVPRAMISWLVIITAGCVTGLALGATSENLAVIALLLVYFSALIKAGHSMAAIYASRAISEFEVTEQADTIGILLRDFSENTSDWLWEVNSEGKLVRGADEFALALKTPLPLLSKASESVVTAPPEEYAIPDRYQRALAFHLNSPNSFRDLLICSQNGDDARWVQISGKPIQNTEGEFVGYRGVASDVSEAKSAEERIAFLAHNDALTGLVNRGEFSRLLNEKMSYGSRDEKWSVLYLDLDGFKAVNDQHGHSIGDMLLGEVAKRLKSIVSDTDVVARLGGDEFAILGNSCATAPSASSVAEKLIQQLSKPYKCEGIHIEVSASIGISLAPSDGNSPFSLLNNADLALYRAKAEGKGTHRFYEREMDDIVKERRGLESDLRAAIRNDELSVFFQPLISSVTGQTSGFEALARWTHPTKGMIPPSEFIPIAERIGVIAEIGEWVLNKACKEARDWPNGLTVAVNLSPQQFSNGNIVSVVKNAIEVNGLDPSLLELEITEGLFMENTDSVMESLSQFKKMGISIAMDDFGTGYSSLSYILKFPFDKLKIDKSFISSIATDDVSKNVLEAITKLGDMLNLKVTAEGVESLDQAKLLEGMSCTHFQGFYFGKPLPSADLPSYLLNEFNNETVKAEQASIEEKPAQDGKTSKQLG